MKNVKVGDVIYFASDFMEKLKVVYVSDYQSLGIPSKIVCINTERNTVQLDITCYGNCGKTKEEAAEKKIEDLEDSIEYYKKYYLS